MVVICPPSVRVSVTLSVPTSPSLVKLDNGLTYLSTFENFPGVESARTSQRHFTHCARTLQVA